MNRKQVEAQLRIYHEDAYWWALQCSNYNEEDAKDVLQNTYVKILEGRAKYNGRSTFKTWLFSVIRFTGIDQLRKTVVFESIESIEIGVEENDLLEDNYRPLMESLSTRQKEVLLLSFYHGMTLEEIAEVLELGVGTVRTHYSRGKDAFRLLLEKEKL